MSLSLACLRASFKHISHGSLALLFMVIASLNLTSFTCVLEFVLNPNLHLWDTVLGLDWSRQHQIAEISPLVLSLERSEGLGE